MKFKDNVPMFAETTFTENAAYVGSIRIYLQPLVNTFNKGNVYSVKQKLV